ncbi:unnamed protein product [Pichia kudriavzevii]
MIDDLMTSVSLELGLKRFDECVGYLKSLEGELETLSQIAIAVGVPKALLNKSTFPSSKVQVSVFAQHVHLIYNLKSSECRSLTDRLVKTLLVEVECSTSDKKYMKEIIEIFKVLNKEKEAVETYLKSRGKELEDCVGMIRVGGSGLSSGNISIDLMNQQYVVRNDSVSNRRSGIMSRPSSVGGTPESELAVPKKTTDVTVDVAGELVTAYVRELSLVYMGYISRVCDEWNEFFIDESDNPKETQKAKKLSNIRLIEWVNGYIEEMKRSVQLTLMDYDKSGEVFRSSVEIMKNVFDGLKDREMNVDYLLEL